MPIQIVPFKMSSAGCNTFILPFSLHKKKNVIIRVTLSSISGFVIIHFTALHYYKHFPFRFVISFRQDKLQEVRSVECGVRSFFFFF